MNVLFVDGYRTGAIRIGDRAAIAPGVVLVASSDPNNSTLRRFAEYVVRGTVTVEADAWVGVGAILLPNIVVGEASIVGAGAVVTKDVPAGTVVAGVPAMPMGSVGRRYHQDGRGTS
jgi:acetyltransferase-like isoleucine patch superfamily enzyme